LLQTKYKIKPIKKKVEVRKKSIDIVLEQLDFIPMPKYKRNFIVGDNINEEGDITKSSGLKDLQAKQELVKTTPKYDFKQDYKFMFHKGYDFT